MKQRFIVVNSRPLEGIKSRDPSESPHWKVRGYRILDTRTDKRLPELYPSRADAQEECDRRNSK